MYTPEHCDIDLKIECGDTVKPNPAFNEILVNLIF